MLQGQGLQNVSSRIPPLLTFYTQNNWPRTVSTQAVGPILRKILGARRFTSRKVGQTDDRSEMAVTNLPHLVAIIGNSLTAV